jgi:LAO/AO transport system kinase
LIDAAASGDRGALAQTLSLVESGEAVADGLMSKLIHSKRYSFVIGITGAPGAGKSTLVGALIQLIRKSGERVAVIAVDPSSPFSQGALLGDRLRMTSGDRDDGVFIRSMASRGEQGGIAAATQTAALAFEACDWPIIIVETVGAGQVEVDIAAMADATVVVVNPGWGDEVQTHKAGLMEVGNVFAINKADRDGAADTRKDLETLLAQRPNTPITTSIVETVATEDSGIGKLMDRILEHRQDCDESGLAERRTRQTSQMLQLAVEQEFHQRSESLLASESFVEAIKKVIDNERSISVAVDDLLN